jgi:hypothetical protein
VPAAGQHHQALRRVECANQLITAQSFLEFRGPTRIPRAVIGNRPWARAAHHRAIVPRISRPYPYTSRCNRESTLGSRPVYARRTLTAQPLIARRPLTSRPLVRLKSGVQFR